MESETNSRVSPNDRHPPSLSHQAARKWGERCSCTNPLPKGHQRRGNPRDQAGEAVVSLRRRERPSPDRGRPCRATATDPVACTRVPRFRFVRRRRRLRILTCPTTRLEYPCSATTLGSGSSEGLTMRASILIICAALVVLAFPVGATPLHDAARNGDAAAIAELLTAGTDPDIRYAVQEGQLSGATPLHVATAANELPAVQVLLSEFESYFRHVLNCFS